MFKRDNEAYYQDPDEKQISLIEEMMNKTQLVCGQVWRSDRAVCGSSSKFSQFPSNLPSYRAPAPTPEIYRIPYSGCPKFIEPPVVQSNQNKFSENSQTSSKPNRKIVKKFSSSNFEVIHENEREQVFSNLQPRWMQHESNSKIANVSTNKCNNVRATVNENKQRMRSTLNLNQFSGRRTFDSGGHKRSKCGFKSWFFKSE